MTGRLAWLQQGRWWCMRDDAALSTAKF